jgi:lysophosphatidate acyltransferase
LQKSSPSTQQHFLSARVEPSSRRTASIPSTMTALTNILKFYLSLPVVMISSSIIGYVSPVSALRFWTRAIACYCTLLLCASYGVVSSIILRIIGRATLAQWTVAKAYSGLTNPLIGWEWEIHGKEHLDNRPAVFISNHQRYLLCLWKVLIL